MIFVPWMEVLPAIRDVVPTITMRIFKLVCLFGLLLVKSPGSSSPYPQLEKMSTE